MFVITADQDASRRRGERVEEILADLAQHVGGDARLVLPFERTVGDEIQGVADDPALVLDVVLHLQRRQDWSVGVGVGSVETLAETARASSGPAFVRARTAVERSRGKGVPVPLALEADAPAAADAEALLQLLAAVVRRRSAAGWEVVDLLAGGTRTAREAARELGISPQAVSQRLRVAAWEEEAGVHPLAVRLLAEVDAEAT